MIKGKTIVLSGINLYEGGPLSVYKDMLSEMSSLGIIDNNHVVLFVHSKELFSEYDEKTEIIELPKSRNSYAYRLYYEYYYFKRFSRNFKIDYWISLHDMTPNVIAGHRYTYCHQPTPFYRAGKLDWKFSKTICLFSLFYKYIYGINIKKNDAVIVQQQWIREEFKKRYKIDNVIVAKPNLEISLKGYFNENGKNTMSDEKAYTFIYASFPRSFKNFETICEACRILDGDLKYNVILTIDGTENAYSKYLRETYGDIEHIEWVGLKPRGELFELYGMTDCMIFPSKLETWGLPISEYKQIGHPIIMADLPYAHETVGEYEMTDFFEYNNPAALAGCMRNAIWGGYFKKHSLVPISAPYAENWTELCDLVFREPE